ncbi:ABC transporter ATP-binding protein [Glycomyces sp. A-F 0318]|uniref:ABC transporter ATP-binding protein n=1 Tax=Glycomyces amatae TaxID=2881355 RepID=UPI001E63579C|nr:ABC transporter ATP-binding protein [Glycomyces amatae]MCD0445332.1 ABC transporter ATP-binding protein [Glycomyces amatae]
MTTAPDAAPVLTVEDLTVVYEVDEPVTAVRGADLTLHRGEILGLAGESGCGKTTLAYAVNRLHRPPARIASGRITFHDKSGEDVDVLALEDAALRAFRWDRLSMVFQGAMNALNPVATIRAQLADTLRAHRPRMSRKEIRDRSEDVLRRVGVDPGRLGSYPHQLSGGMRQRVMIAMAMLLEPQIMIMDEPTTALDVVVQRDILREIVRLRDELDFAVVFITHDLPLLLEISDRIAVMLEGEIVELDTAERLYRQAAHPYTRKLLGSFPSLSGERGAFIRTGIDETDAGETGTGETGTDGAAASESDPTEERA